MPPVDPPHPTPPAAGQPLHTRTVAIDVALDTPGKLRAEGEILDLRKVGVVPTGGELQTAGFIHHMQLHVWVDLESGVIERLEAHQPHVPFEATATTGGESCRDVVPRLDALVGQSIEEAFHPTLAGCFGGPLGCSHLLTLAQAMGAMLPEVLANERRASVAAVRTPAERVAKRAIFLDGVAGEGSDMDIVIQLSDFETRPLPEVTHALERLARQREVRVVASVDLEAMTIHTIHAWERDRTTAQLIDLGWSDRSADVAGLAGGPALRGLAAVLLKSFEGDASAGLLLAALLQFAPGLIQCFAARTEALLAQFSAGASKGRTVRELPRELSVGGMPDSCYMWRSGGVMSENRTTFRNTDGD